MTIASYSEDPGNSKAMRTYSLKCSPLYTHAHTNIDAHTHTARRMGCIYMRWRGLWGIGLGRACEMIGFSRDKKTSVLICGDEKRKAAPLSPASPLGFRQLVCPRYGHLSF